MRIILIALLVFPTLSFAQINRSAAELARETTREYLVTKIFKDKVYIPVSYGKIKAVEDTRSETAWTIEHHFEIEETQTAFEKKARVRKPYKFVFYLDKKMKVLRAVSAFTE